MALFLALQDGSEQIAQCVVAGSHHRGHGMDDTVDGRNVAVLVVDEGVVDGDAVGVGQPIVHHQLAVVEVGQGNFGPLCGREAVGFVIHQVAAIDDAVIDNPLADGVERKAVAEAFPRRTVDEAHRVQALQVCLNGIVGGHKAGVIASRREQLPECGLGPAAHLHLPQKVEVFAVLFVFFQIAGNRLLLEHITGRGVNFLLAPHQDDQAKDESRQ